MSFSSCKLRTVVGSGSVSSRMSSGWIVFFMRLLPVSVHTGPEPCSPCLWLFWPRIRSRVNLETFQLGLWLVFSKLTWPEAFFKLFRHSATAIINFKPPVVLYSRLTIFPNVNVMWPQMSSLSDYWILSKCLANAEFLYISKCSACGTLSHFFLQQCIQPSALP